MKSPTEEIFDQRVAEFEQKYITTHIDEVAYVKATWLDLYKEKLVKAWVDCHLHFGNVVTSRVEGVHTHLKSHLKRSTLDLFEAWKAIKHALLNQLAELRSNQAKQQIRTPIELSGPLYSGVRGWVSHKALRKVEEQRKLLLRGNGLPSARCTGYFTQSQGLPCVHRLEALWAENKSFQLQDFHSHWHLARNSAEPFLLEPRQRIDSATIASSLPPTSNRRESSGFEVVENVILPRGPPQCANCHAVGHRKTSHLCPLRHTALRARVEAASYQLKTAQKSISEVQSQPPVPNIPTQSIPSDNAASPEPEIPVPLTLELPTCTNCHITGHTKFSSVCPLRGTELRQQVDAVQQRARALQGSISEAQSRSMIPEIFEATTTPEAKQQLDQQPEPRQPEQPIKYDDPRAIYQRYISARDTWYKNQPRGSYVNNQMYRKAMGLPLRYNKASYDWCLDYKQMTKHCVTPAGTRDWKREEMMAYLDWDRSESDRIDAQIAKESANSLSNRRGMGELWRRADQDREKQQAIYTAE